MQQGRQVGWTDGLPGSDQFPVHVPDGVLRAGFSKAGRS